ncbi:fatty acid desaturase [Alcanivorax sp. JB21]|uniref:fatty acid desaturase n=1 Tax=Alcanivorax limicola TaxID=2874102 RepID=UPI001CBFB7D1|nr:fatty acid desaturase [Alcanivorax limicola]MBZ2188708.1 fatty acid desaturase [Alcanivorax limicola]
MTSDTASKTPVSTCLPGQDDARLLARLKVSPVLAWPTVLLLVGGLGTLVLSWYSAINGIWPMWLAMLVNGVAGYVLFTPSHEAIHRCASNRMWLNDLILALATFVAVPFGRGKLFRLMHMRHHRFANEEKDPDHWLASDLRTLPLWGFWPFLYLYRYFRDPGALPGLTPTEIRRELLVAGVLLTGLFVWQPYYMLMLWLIPSYLSYFLMCLVFMVLPHYPHTGRQDEDPHRTALMRMGQEWWLTPVLMYQNYHLVHHLYPTIPFYRYGKAWAACQQRHLAKSGSMIIGPFGLGPRDNTAGVPDSQKDTYLK